MLLLYLHVFVLEKWRLKETKHYENKETMQKYVCNAYKSNKNYKKRNQFEAQLIVFCKDKA